ncbi:MAG: efflux RND transporter periplasmic adaptor subunit [Desulfuromonadaceae bacterium]|nr:efflux RND transporter periplasmic adaptor subunit [Desulfuromonadaceae bacterium]MDD2855584.1 efflux RND transporter periplasmic adaptor subunit [Desulfuromonadaceae bacterium]
MKSIYKVALLSTITISLLASGCGKKQAGPPPGPQGSPEVGVITIKPERVVLTTEMPGRTAPRFIAEVRPQVGGIIQKRTFVEGSNVTAGQILYQIDPASFEAAYASSKASEARAEANLSAQRLKAGRYRDLVKINAVSQQDNDDIQASLKQAEADVAFAKAAVETARINLAYTKIVAPISGRIGRSSVTEGALVTASQPNALATIQQLDYMYVDVTQSTADLIKLKQNLADGVMKKGGAAEAPVKLILEDGSAYQQTGTLKFSEVTVDQNTGSVTMRALFPNSGQTLLPGMFVRAQLVEGVSNNAILVPQRGVSRNPKGDATVMVVGAEEKAEQRIIKVVRTIGDSWLVSDGLKVGDRVILEGLQKARSGTPVRAVPFGSPPAPSPTSNAQQTPVKK